MSDKRQQETRRLAEAAESEIDREFETASLAMMRAFEAFQRYEAALEDLGIEDVTAVSRWLASKQRRGRLHAHDPARDRSVPNGTDGRAGGAEEAGRVRPRTLRHRPRGASADAEGRDRRPDGLGREPVSPDGRVLQGAHR